MMQVNRTYAWLLLVLALPLGAGASQAAGAKAEPNDSATLASLLNLQVNAGAETTVGAGKPLADDITQRLWRSRMSVPAQTDDGQTRVALNEVLSRIRSVKFEPKEHGAPAFTVPEPVVSQPVIVSNRTTVEPQVVQRPTTTSPGPSDGTLSSETVDALKRVLADPNQASEPLALAELLFLTGRRNEAAVLYQKALDSTTGDQASAREDRAWILLQLGNCLRETNPARARDMYTKLVAEYPDSPWVELAKAHSQLISWYEQVQPQQWLPGSEVSPTRQVAASQRPQP